MRGRRLPSTLLLVGATAVHSTLLLVGATAVHSHLSCPPGFELWHGDNLCYAFAAGPATQTFAQAYCGSFNNGRLACPSTREVIDFIAERAGNGGHDLWIGWSDTLHEGSWICPPTALAQVNESWLPWCVGEPNNGGGGSQSKGTPDGGDCVRVVGHEGGKCPVGTWADYRCDASHGPQHGTDLAEFGFVCSSTPTSEDAPVGQSAADAGASRDDSGTGAASTLPWGWALVLCVALVASGGINGYLCALQRWRSARGARGAAGGGEAGLSLRPLRPMAAADSAAEPTLEGERV
jgi:hypothetical protein